MRRTWAAVALILGLVLASSGCSREVAGAAQRDPERPGITLTEDGYAFVAGYADAPLQLEIFTDPQCARCAELQRRSADDMMGFVESGQLAVTYRPLTFLDDIPAEGYSAEVANAWFLAAGSGLPAKTMLTFIRDVFAQQPDYGDPGLSADEIAAFAQEAGVPTEAVDKIAAEDNGVDLETLYDNNLDALINAGPSASVPTVVDIENGELVDLENKNWLDDLIEAA